MVYVDDARNPFGRMLMAHMIADTTDELLAMADQIGVARRHIQHAGTAREHFDICRSKRGAAVEAGAIPVTPRELVAKIQKRRKDHLCPRTPTTSPT